MKRHFMPFLFRTALLVLPFGLLTVACLGQSGLTRECKEKDYICRYNNYTHIVFAKCKASEGFDYECFIAEQTKIVGANPNDIAAYIFRGITSSPRDPDQAVTDFEKVLELDPQYLPAYSYLAWAYKTKGEYDRAFAVLDRGIGLYPKDSNLYAIRGRFYIERRDLGKALADFDKVVELEPDSDRGYLGRAEAYSDRRFYNALAEYNKAIEVNPSNWLNYYRRGLLYSTHGEKEKAGADCQKAKELKKGDGRPIPKQMSDKYCPL
jgi:tetratricopeptide (TPR) repeat protein